MVTTECKRCRSLVNATPAAMAFHQRRCEREHTIVLLEHERKQAAPVEGYMTTSSGLLVPFKR